MKAKALAALLLTLCLSPAAAALAAGPPAALVRVGQVVQKEVETKVTFTSTAEAHRMITVASRVEALAQRGLVQEGQRVAKGQVLLELDTSRMQLQLNEAQALLKEGTETLEQLKRDLTRSQRLQERKAVPLKNLEDAQTAVDRQTALVEQQRERIKLLKLDLAYASIKAPVSGVVVKRLAWRGEWVKKGGPVLVLAVLDPIKVVVKVPERYLPALAEGQQACATADALPGREFCGKITAIIPSGDDRSRAFPVQVSMANPDAQIKPGMFMRLTLAVGRRHPALLVPKDALVMSGQSHSVYAVIQGKAVPLPVKLVAAHGDMLEVTGGLKPGMTIVTVGNERLFPGQPVKVAPPAPPAK